MRNTIWFLVSLLVIYVGASLGLMRNCYFMGKIDGYKQGQIDTMKDAYEIIKKGGGAKD